jgi:hypothetical protein
MQSSIGADRDCAIWISPEKSLGITRAASMIHRSPAPHCHPNQR